MKNINHLLKCSSVSAAILIGIASLAKAENRVIEMAWVTDNSVFAVASVGPVTYIGGNFTKVGPFTGGGVPLDATSGLPATSFPAVIGEVGAVAPDGSGGWYIGGLFSQVGNVKRNNVAHVSSDGTVDSAWDPEANSSVSAVIVNSGVIYIE